MKVFWVVVFMFASFAVPASADDWTNCDEYGSREELIEVLQSDLRAWGHYDTDEDGVACESTLAVTKQEAPYISPIDVSFGCEDDDSTCKAIWFANEQENTKIAITTAESDALDKMYAWQTEQTLGEGYADITDTPSEEQLDFSHVDDHRTFWNAATGRVVVVASLDKRFVIIEYNTVDDATINEIVTNALTKGELPKTMEGYEVYRQDGPNG